MNARAPVVVACLALAPWASVRAATPKPVEPGLTVVLVDADAKASHRSATVMVDVRGLKLVDAAEASEKPAKGQGHLHYKLDDGPVIATTATKLSFHGLTAGPHTFTVHLAANDHAPIGEPQAVSVTVP